MTNNISLEHITQLIETKVREATDPLLAKIVELSDYVNKLESQVFELTKEVDDVNQQGRKEYLILDGDALPAYSESENTRRVATETLKRQLDITFPESDLTACHRLQNRAKIIIKCKSRDLKDDIYSARMSQQNTRKTLYIRESLTPRRNAQVAQLVEMKKEGSISNFYTRNGIIFARKNKEMRYVKIEPGSTKAMTLELVTGAQRQDQYIRQSGPPGQAYPHLPERKQETKERSGEVRQEMAQSTRNPPQPQRMTTRSTSGMEST